MDLDTGHHAYPVIGTLPVQAVDTNLVLKVLEPIWTTNPETAGRVRGRINHKRVERIWRREELEVPVKQKKRSRFWLNDGSRIRLRPCWPNHVWSYDLVHARTHDGKAFRILTEIDEYTRRCMALNVESRLTSDDVLHCLTGLFVEHGPPDHIRSDNGLEFTANAVRTWQPAQCQNALH